MEIPKNTLTRCCRTALLAAVCSGAALTAGAPAGGAGMAEAERARRHASVEEAQELLRKGDEAYQAGRYADAMEAYAGARELLPKAPLSADLRGAATQRFVQAAIGQSRVLAKAGDVAGAKAAIHQALRDDVAPADPGARAELARLDDPIRTNPAATVGHTKNVDAVRRELYTAEGAYDLGKFDEAKDHYHNVLRLDPTNSAARRGLERVAAAVSRYAKTAYDHTRAEMLGQVAAAWETAVGAPELGDAPIDPGARGDLTGTRTLAAKIDQIIIPKVALDQATLDEAIDFLRLKAAEHDVLESDPARKGVNITVNLGAADSPVAKKIRALRFDLRLNEVPLARVLRYINDLTQTTYRTDDFSVVVTPVGSSSDELMMRVYRVRPDFLTAISGTTEGGIDDHDPFKEGSPKEGLLAKRLTAKEALEKQGVGFPEGASASYSPATNILRVVNTPVNHDFIEQIVEINNQTEPVTVVVRVTMIRTQRTVLNELGMDWLVSPFAVTSSNEWFAGGGTTGSGAPRLGRDFISPVDGTPVTGVPLLPNSKVTSGTVTSGLRSGDYAIPGNNLDGFLNNPAGSAQENSVAPGVLSVTGLFSNSQVQAILRGLNQKKNVDVMAKPSVVTRSGQASKVEIIKEFIYPTEYEPPEIPTQAGNNNVSPATPANPTAFEKRDVGIAMEVLPVADANKRYIDVTLNPEFSDFDGFVNYGTPINTVTTNALGGSETVEITPNAILMPVFSVHRANTQLTVADGATIVIGGLLQERVQNIEDKVPVLGSIPVLGRLFQTTVKQPVSTAIIFMVHVELLDPTGRPYRER